MALPPPPSLRRSAACRAPAQLRPRRVVCCTPQQRLSHPTAAGTHACACPQASAAGAEVASGAAGHSGAEPLGAPLAAGANAAAAALCCEGENAGLASTVGSDARVSSRLESSPSPPDTRQASFLESGESSHSMQHCAELAASARGMHAAAVALRWELQAAAEEAGQRELPAPAFPQCGAVRSRGQAGVQFHLQQPP